MGLWFSAGLIVWCTAFRADPEFNAIQWSQTWLSRCFDPFADNIRLKKWELSISNEGFFRLRKHFPNGKQEYFSFYLKRFDDMNYIGTTGAGTILLKTQNQDIIVQTYNDPKGNIDSMTNILPLPVKNIEPEQLDSLQHTLASLKQGYN